MHITVLSTQVVNICIDACIITIKDQVNGMQYTLPVTYCLVNKPCPWTTPSDSVHLVIGIVVIMAITAL